MVIEQIYTSCLSQASYFISSNGESAVIDPIRDTDIYIKKAEKMKSKIKYVFQTHFHADFVSGHLNLSKKTNAPVVYGPNADPKYDCIISNDNKTFNLGDLKIKLIHTPGHTLESSSYLLIDSNNNPHSIFTGDTLFLGDVGIPDVAQRYEGISKEKLAEMLFDSINNKIKPLDDNIIVYPGHGAGSACGKNMMKETVDTLANQKKVNYSLNGKFSKNDFVLELVKDLPEPPAYFPQNVKLNREGYRASDEILNDNLKNLTADYVFDKIKSENVVVVDTRKPSDYCNEHIPGSIFIGLSGRFAPWVGEILKDINQEIILIVENGKEEEAITRLSRVGFDNCIGYLDSGIESWKSAGYSTENIRSIDPGQFVNEFSQNSQIIDVREKSELINGKFKFSKNIPLSKIDSHKNIYKNLTSYVYCAGGYRSVIACSLLKRYKFKELVNVESGFSGISKLI